MRGKRKSIIDHNADQHDKGYPEINQLTADGAERYQQAGKIDFIDKSGVIDNGTVTGGHGIGEERPGNQGGIDENRIGDVVGRNFGKFSENNREDHHLHNRLDYRPGDADQGLFVLDNKIFNG